MRPVSNNKMHPDQALNVAISALAFIAGDETLLQRFIALTGLEAAQFRQMSDNPEFMIAILDFYLGDEPSLLSFASSTGMDPADIKKARFSLDRVEEERI